MKTLLKDGETKSRIVNVPPATRKVSGECIIKSVLTGFLDSS